MEGGKVEDWRGVKEGVSSNPQKKPQWSNIGDTQKHSHLFSALHD